MAPRQRSTTPLLVLSSLAPLPSQLRSSEVVAAASSGTRVPSHKSINDHSMSSSNGNSSTRAPPRHVYLYCVVACLWSVVCLSYTNTTLLNSLSTANMMSYFNHDESLPEESIVKVSTCLHLDDFLPRPPAELQNVYQKQWLETKRFVQETKLTFLPEEVLDFHGKQLERIEALGLPGMILECGVAKAGSSIMFASMKDPRRCLHLFDTFQGIPEPSVERDGPDVLKRYKRIQAQKQACLSSNKAKKLLCNKNYYGNMDDLLQFDQDQFVEAGYSLLNNSVTFHKGLFDDTVWPAGPVAYAHLDGDWYDSTMHMLERISPYLILGGRFVLDDVYYWSGAKLAFCDFFNVEEDWLQQAETNENNKEGKECIATTTLGQVFWLRLEIRATAELLSNSTTTAPSAGMKEGVLPCRSPAINATTTTTV